MDYQVVFAALETVCEDVVSLMSGPTDLPYGTVAKRLVTSMKQIQEHGRALKPVVRSFTAVYHHYDFDAQTPGNGYRTLVKVGLTQLTGCIIPLIISLIHSLHHFVDLMYLSSVFKISENWEIVCYNFPKP